jgi:hypothetical protein
MPEPVKGPQSVSVGNRTREKPKLQHGPKGPDRSNDSASAVLAIRMNCKDQERSIGLPFDQAMIKQLVLEAKIRGMRIGELLAHSFSRS